MATKKHLMLVEDDVNLGNMIYDSLEINDYTVTLYRNGEEAWNNFEKGKYVLNDGDGIICGFSLVSIGNQTYSTMQQNMIFLLLLVIVLALSTSNRNQY